MSRCWRWRLWRLRRRLSLCHFDAIEVWPDEEPILPTSRGVKAHGYHSSHLTPLGVWRAAREWEQDRAEEIVRVEHQRLERVRDWFHQQQGYCRPPELARASSEEVNERRGPCASYGAVVWGLAANKLDAILAGQEPSLPGAKREAV